MHFKSNEKVVKKKNLNMMLCALFALSISISVCDANSYNTTAVATNIESTIGSPEILVDPTLISTRNTTIEQYETILKITPFSNTTAEPDETTTYAASTDDEDYIDLNELIERVQQNTTSEQGNDNSSNVEFNLNAQTRQAALLKQLNLPANLFGNVAFRRPCECDNGICGCCTGMLFSALRQMGCMNITYHPDDFSFEFKMIMNNAVLYKNRVTGRNPPPVCVRVPRLNFIRMCASFYDLHFIGRNMHVCLEMSAYFQENEIFNRSFDCMRIGDKGVKIVRPDDPDFQQKPGTDAEIDAGGYDDVEDYDENAVVRRRRRKST